MRVVLDIELITVNSQMVDASNVNMKICDDSNDDKFIECAIAGNSKIIVSGDKHLLKVSGVHGISVIKPREFVEGYLR